MVRALSCIGLLCGIALAGCSSSGSDGAAGAAADLQGRWASTCNVTASGNSSGRVEVTVTGTTATFANTEYLRNTTCSGDLSRSQTDHVTYRLTGEETELTDGNAKNVDITLNRVSYTASQAYLDILTEEGITLADDLAAVGVTFPDLNNVTPEQLERDPVEYTIYRIDTNADGTLELRTGSTSVDASTPEMRPDRLSSVRRFDRLP